MLAASLKHIASQHGINQHSGSKVWWACLLGEHAWMLISPLPLELWQHMEPAIPGQRN